MSLLSLFFFPTPLWRSERLKREEQGRLEQEKWKRRMENESAEAQEQLSDMGMLSSELRGSLAQKEKEITSLQGRWETHRLAGGVPGYVTWPCDTSRDP